MLYGVPIYDYTMYNQYGDDTYNIGDYIQSYAIYEFYRSIGVIENDIRFISICELKNYKGPYMIVLFNMYGGLLELVFSPYIIPVFWGFSFAGYINDSIASILKQNEPIGCRDATTLYNVRTHGISAFLSGCITLTLKKRTNRVVNGKFFFIDTPDELGEYIPDQILHNAVMGSHLVSASFPFTKEEAMLHYNQAINQLLTYKNEASMVVTGRLHCASPCIAMGIPVIIAKKNKDTNMGWIERITPIFTVDVFSEIDWSTEAALDEELKTRMRESAKKMIIDNTKHSIHYDLSYEFEKSIDDSYNTVLKEKLERIVSSIGKKNFKFAIWGLGDGGGIAYRMIKEEYPDSECLLCIDSFKQGGFYGMRISRPNSLVDYLADLDYVFLTTYSGRKQAVEHLMNIGLHQNEDFSFLLSRVNGEDSYFKV